MSNRFPLVSIGMPVYNGERFIAQALDSLLAQEYQNIELIISDNASTDRTAEICQQYLRRDRRIQYYQNETNLGSIANFNRVLGLSSGEYFMWAAYDDVWLPTFVSSAVQLLSNAPDATLASCISAAIDENGNVLGIAPRFSHLAGSTVFDCLTRYLLQNEIWGKACLIYSLMRREQILAIGGLRIWGKTDWGLDAHVVFRLLTIGRVVLTDKVLWHKRLIIPPISCKATERSLKQRRFITLSRTIVSQMVLHSLGLVMSRIQSLRDFHGYISGCRRIIDVSDLSKAQKTTLQALCTYRIIVYIFGGGGVLQRRARDRTAFIKP